MTCLIHPAVVMSCRVATDGLDRYLRLAENGTPSWMADPEKATVFESMRDAARAAARLPAHLRAFGLPQAAQPSGARPGD